MANVGDVTIVWRPQGLIYAVRDENGPAPARAAKGGGTVTDREEPPTMEALARRYLDLWQDQWAALCADPAVADSMARTMTAFGQTALTFNGVWEQTLGSAAAANPWLDMMKTLWPAPGAKGTESHDEDNTGAAGTAAAAPGTASAGPASGRGNGDLAELAGRIAALERELAALAPDPAGPGSDAAPKPGPASGRRRRPGRRAPAG